MKFLRSTGTALALLAAIGTAANAQIILRTGVNASNTTIAAGALDPFWTISINGGSFAAARAAFAGDANTSIICCGMETVGSQALWISDPSMVAGSNATAWGVGPTVRLDRTFDLTGYDLSTVAFSGIWRVADNQLGVFINGNLIAGTDDGSSGWFTDQAIAAGSSFFTAGINTIELRGSSGNSTWDGFWLDGTVTGNAATTTPEPGTMALLGTGLVGMMGVARRRRR